MSESLKIKVIIGSTRKNRFGDKPARWIAGLLEKKEGVETEILDLRDYPMPFFDEAETPNYKSAPYTEPHVAAWTKKIAEADGFIVIAAEYNHGYTAVLKNALDYVAHEWRDKAVGFVGYGSALGSRAIEQLRGVVVELQMAPIRYAVHMPFEVVMAGNKGTPESELFSAFDERAGGMLDQLIAWSMALKTLRMPTNAA
ncbi:MAG: NADPH-dependent FMN reductase [Minisyncoccota bacterium]